MLILLPFFLFSVVIMTDRKLDSAPRRNRGRKRRRTTFSKRSSSKSASFTARRAMSMVRNLQKKQEVKTFYSPHSIFAVPTIGTVTQLNDVNIGGLANNRDGNSISIFRIQVKYLMFSDPTVLDISFRIILFIDTKQVLGVKPLPPDILQSVNVTSFPILRDRTRFQYLADHAFTLNSASKGATNGMMDVSKKIISTFDGTDGQSINNNGVYLLILHTEQSAALPTMTLDCLVSFNDN